MTELRDVEALADAVLAAVDADTSADTSADGDVAIPDGVIAALRAAQRLGVEFVRRYNRLEIGGAARALDEPVLFVANHGFGGIFDLNVFAVLAAFDDMHLDRPVTILTHQLAWTLGVGRLLEPLGLRPASAESAREAFAAGHHVLVLPGGDIDAFKSFADRDRIIFGGRRGFARLASERHVPIMPMVTAGAGESLFVVSDGARLARALRLDKILRAKAFPISVSLPFGVSIGAVGLLPYLPLPTKLRTCVLDPMRKGTSESDEQFGDRVEAAMQDALTAMTENRTPVLG